MSNEPDDLIRGAFLRCIQFENDCVPTGRPCHDKCGCLLEIQDWVEEQRGDSVSSQKESGNAS